MEKILEMRNRKEACTVIVSGVLAFSVVIVTLYLLKYAPFGSRALTCMDADIQYLDFYQYYKDVLSGTNNIFYSFSKMLGGGAIAIFSYYLSSPFCLLLIFFDKTNLHIYFDLTVALKVAVAAMACSFFVLKRFERYIVEKTQYILAIIFALSYALGQYTIAQASNIMWLDGVYMLPLILLAVYHVVIRKRNARWKLAALVGYAIIANWYSAGIDCVFSGCWFLFEVALNTESFGKKPKLFGKVVVQYIFSMLTGVLLSAILFLPTIGALKNSTRGSLQLNKLFDFSWQGNVSNSIDHYVFGSISNWGSAALFCGSVAIVASVCVFVSKTINKKNKLILAIMGIFAVAMCYWNPLFVIFSLFKDATSYWYRYSYLSIFIIIFLAATYLFHIEKDAEIAVPVVCAVGIACAILGVSYMHGSITKNTYLTAGIIGMTGIILSFSLKLYRSEKQMNRYRVLPVLGLLLITVVELQYNASLIMQVYYADDVDAFKKYQKQEETQISLIKEYDDKEIYRITQTSVRGEGPEQYTAYYNESLGYNYWSLSGYTSSPDDIQREFLQCIGYRMCGENLNVVNTSILGADSLLGVKYVLSKYPIRGLNKIDNIPRYNEKDVYENPFCLPMAFVYNKAEIEQKIDNPFEYQNALWSQLYGEYVEIYEKVGYEVEQEGNVEDGTPLKFKLFLPQGNYAIYGNLPWNTEIDGRIIVNNEPEIVYSCWLSPSVFYIATDENDTEATVTVSSAISYDLKREETQFYALNLNKLKMVADALKQNTPSEFTIDNGHLEAFVENAKDGQQLYVSVPYDSGWKIKQNGKVIQADLMGDCMYSIPLVAGENHIEMSYHVAYWQIGCIISAMGVIILGLMIIYEKKQMKYM